jgi:DNA-binding NarL/FixJ family response regulator
MLSIRVLILSDDPLVRNALSSLLPEEKTIDLVGQAPLMGLGEDLLDVYRPDVFY